MIDLVRAGAATPRKIRVVWKYVIYPGAGAPERHRRLSEEAGRLPVHPAERG
jgi:hypothetical protein